MPNLYPWPNPNPNKQTKPTTLAIPTTNYKIREPEFPKFAVEIAMEIAKEIVKETHGAKQSPVLLRKLPF